MGSITVKVDGSFNSASTKGHAPKETLRQFSAAAHGHAHAVQETIAYLTNDVLPAAINLDHELHDDGDAPAKGYAKPYA